MKTQFRKSIEEYCAQNENNVNKRIDETRQKLHNFTNGNGVVLVKTSISEDVGDFGGRTIDIARLGDVIGSIKRTHIKNKEKNKETIHCAQQFDKYKNDNKYFKPLFLTPDKSVEQIKKLCSEFMNDYVDLFRAFRRADLLLNRKYNPAIHDQALENLSWQSLKAAELQQIPPVIVELSVRKIDGKLTASIQDIVTAGVPVKLAVFLKHTESIKELIGRETALNVNPSPGFQALFLRGVYVCQISLGSQNPDAFNIAIKDALQSNRPAMLSVLDAPQNEARLANTSRSFVHFTYDPDASSSFQKCININDNPDLENNWGYDEDGFDFSPAHYLIQTGRFESEFKDAADLTDKISIKEFFGSSKNGTPVIVSNTKEYQMSNGVISYCANHIDHWNTLRSLAGIDNPQLTEAIEETKAQARSENNNQIDQMRSELIQKYESAQHQSMKSVMKKLVINLLSISENASSGMDFGDMDSSQVVATMESTEPSSGEKTLDTAVGTSLEEPWLETDMCTACDECVTINDAIFAYNEDKLAIIKDPNAGPYRDIVKAAEKCSAGIIHPGLPLNKQEKDLDKWTKRAAKFN